MAFYSPLFRHHIYRALWACSSRCHRGPWRLRLTEAVVGRQKGGLSPVCHQQQPDGRSCISLAKAWLTRQARFPSASLLISPMSIINQMAKTQEPNSEWLSVKVLECPFIRTVFACNCSWSVIQNKPNQKMRLKPVRKLLLFWHS